MNPYNLDTPKEVEMATFSCIVKCLKTRQLPTLIRDMAFSQGVEILRLEVEKHFIQETVRFKIRGERSVIVAFSEFVKENGYEV